MSNLLDEPGADPEGTPADKTPVRPWLRTLATSLPSIAGAWAVNQFSSSLGYPGLTGIVALSGVVVAAVWIRGLDPRARLPRYAPWLFMIPAACLAAIAAFSAASTASILTVIAAVLTVGAVLITKEFLSTARLLRGVALIAVGAESLAFGSKSLTDHYALIGAASIALGAAFIAEGVGNIADRDAVIRMARNMLVIACAPFVIAVALDPNPHTGGTMSAGTRPLVFGATIVLTAGGIAWWAAIIGGRHKLVTGALIAFGVGSIGFAGAFLASGGTLIGAASIALGAAAIAIGIAKVGPRTIMARIQQLADWATKVPQGAEDQEAEAESMPPAGARDPRWRGPDHPVFAAIAGRFLAAWWQTSRADKIARTIRRAERREEGLLVLNVRDTDVHAAIDRIYRQPRQVNRRLTTKALVRSWPGSSSSGKVVRRA